MKKNSLENNEKSGNYPPKHEVLTGSKEVIIIALIRGC